MDIQFPITCDACGDDNGVAVIPAEKEKEFSEVRFLCMECAEEPEEEEEEEEK